MSTKAVNARDIRAPQTEWLVEQLKTLAKNKPLFVALHHPVYSADDHHSGSTPMKKVLESAFAAAGRAPEMILAGHVHDYQCLTKTAPDGTQTIHLVAGAGGYHNLHNIMKVNGGKMIAPVVFNEKQSDPVTLEKYSDDHHGFFRFEITDKLITGSYYTVPRPQEPYSRKRKYIPNTLS